MLCPYSHPKQFV